MLPRVHRLRREGDYRRVYGHGRTTAGATLVVKYRAGTQDVPRIGVVVGSKVSKRSVQRNLLRRRIREVLRKHLASIPKRTDIIVIAKPQARDRSFAELTRELIPLLQNLKVIRS